MSCSTVAQQFVSISAVLCAIVGVRGTLGRAGETSDFSGSQLMSVIAGTQEQLRGLIQLYEKEDFDFWATPSLNESTNILVTRNDRLRLQTLLGNLNLKGQVIIDDVSRLARSQQKSLFQARQAEEMSWEAYHYPETIFTWLWKLATRHSRIVDVIMIGHSFEDQPLQLIKISTGNSSEKFGVFIDGGIHAREWISPAVVTYVINELVTNASSNMDLLDTYDFYILPIMNPDGYRHTCKSNRLWRKSRRSFGMLGDLVGCRGIDLNRNFGHHWREWGSGFSPCSNMYAGSAPFSEPESRAVRDFVREHHDIDWKFYFSLHSFGQKWMTPWGYSDEHPKDYDELLRVAKIGNDALKAVHGSNYRVGSISRTLYTASGTSTDWFKSIGVPYSYTIELRDYGLFGFLLPAYQIRPTSEEVWAGMRASLLAVKESELSPVVERKL